MENEHTIFFMISVGIGNHLYEQHRETVEPEDSTMICYLNDTLLSAIATYIEPTYRDCWNFASVGLPNFRFLRDKDVDFALFLPVHKTAARLRTRSNLVRFRSKS